jgi:hypothetical protein
MVREPITVDAGAWTGMSDWPSPKDYPRPNPLRAKASLTKHLVSSGAVSLLGLTALHQMYAPSKPGVLRWVGMGFFFLSAAAYTFVTLLRAYGSRNQDHWFVAMDSHGLSIPSWFEEAVPWSEIDHAEYIAMWDIRTPVRGLLLTVKDERRFGPTGSRPWSQLMPFVGVLWMLDVSQKEMLDAIQAHRAHFGNGGRAS